jgi:hypothetical protein
VSEESAVLKYNGAPKPVGVDRNHSDMIKARTDELISIILDMASQAIETAPQPRDVSATVEASQVQAGETISSIEGTPSFQDPTPVRNSRSIQHASSTTATPYTALPTLTTRAAQTRTLPLSEQSAAGEESETPRESQERRTAGGGNSENSTQNHYYGPVTGTGLTWFGNQGPTTTINMGNSRMS